MGTIVQPAPNTVAYPLNVNSADAIKPWIKGAAGADALLRTDLAYKDYLSGPFASWLMNYSAGRAEEPAPAPPMGKVAELSADELSWDLIDGTTPSGPVPAYAKRSIIPAGGPPGTNPFHGGSRTPLVAKIGERATQADGTTWLRLS